MPLKSGEQFAGYRILQMIGSGGMGEIYLAQHPRLPRHDALKVLPAHMSSDTAFRDRFSREADLAASLYHPHIVGVHDRGEDRGQLWIAMDYIDGTDAGRLVREYHPRGLPPAEVVEIVAAIAEALDYAHARGLLHRDVKPGNILLSRPVAGRRRILLADFGIARSITDTSQLTRTNMALGTVHYASPEQLRNQPLDGRTDQYSLAATAFELLTGAPPFDDPSAAVVMSQHLTSNAPTLASTRPELAALDVPFAIALSKFPGDRFRTCEEFVQSLQTHLHHGRRGTRAMSAPVPSAPPPAPAPPPVANSPRRHSALLWPLVIAAVVAVIVIAALVINSQSGPDDTATTPVTIPPAISTSQSTTTTTTTETPGTFEAMRDVVTSYYAQLPDDTGSAWKMLSDSYQEQTGGRREYQSFWSSIRSVSVDSVSPRDDTSVSAQLTYVLRNGSTSSEQRWFQIEDIDGTPVIADSGLGS
jgi:serine/threonine-protein kinase